MAVPFVFDMVARLGGGVPTRVDEAQQPSGVVFAQAVEDIVAQRGELKNVVWERGAGPESKREDREELNIRPFATPEAPGPRSRQVSFALFTAISCWRR